MTVSLTSTTLIALPDGSGPYGVTATRDGAIWVTLVHSGDLLRLAADGRRDRYPIGSVDSRPSIVAVAPDEAVWFTRNGDDCISAVDSRGVMTTVELESGCGPYGICVAPEGTVWFTESTGCRLGRLDVDGTLTYVTLPDDCFPAFATACPDGTIWAALNQSDAVARVSPAGDVTIVDLPTKGAAPVGITYGGGAVWTAEIGAGRIGRITDDGVKEFALPDRQCRPHAITAGVQGCWFTEWAANRVGHVAWDGTVDEFDLPATVSEPHGIAVAPDGAVWVALESGSVMRLA